MNKPTQRRLAAIISADVVGYSRLMGVDEVGTLAGLRAHRAEFIDAKITEHGGRIVKTMGDGLLLEFPSVVDATTCSIEVQEGMAVRNEEVAEEKRIIFRIGINLGDIIIEGEDIHGDGVNVAARLEGLAKPGGVCISANVHDQVRDRLDRPFEDLGEREIKNIARPVRVWQWSPRGQHSTPDVPATYETPPLPDKPSIAVLPFENMSGDPEQDFFADGMAEDIITGLSRFGSLMVIARNSTFSFKGQSIDVKEVAGALGVRYVLEGSVRKGGNRIRITGQLIDAESGNHLWAERYDREVSDIFAVQDEVTDAIVSTIAPEIEHTERARARRKPPSELDAWSLYQRGLADFYLGGVPNLETAIETFDRINRMDSEFALAWAMGAFVRTRYIQAGRPDSRDTMILEARERVQTALRLDPRDPLCVFADGTVLVFERKYDIGISRLREATELNPNDALVHWAIAYAYDAAGRQEECVPAADQAIRLSPRDANISRFFSIRGFALFHLRRYQEAFDSAHRAIHSPNPVFWAFLCYAVAGFKLGELDAANSALEEVYSRVPDFSLSYMRESLRHHQQDKIREAFEVLRALGVPE